MFKDIHLHASRQSHTELLSWLLRSEGKTIRLGLVQSCIIPKQPILKLNTFISKSILPRFNSTLTNTEGRFSELLNAPKTIDSLNQLKTLSLSVSNELRFEALKYFLKFKKFDYIEEILKNEKLSIQEESIKVSQLAINYKFKEIIENYKEKDLNNEILLNSFNTLIELQKPQLALLLWINLVSIKYPKLDLSKASPENKRFYINLLNPIINKTIDMNQYLLPLNHIDSLITKRNFLYLIGKRYIKSDFIKVRKLWKITPNDLKSNDYFELIFTRLYHSPKDTLKVYRFSINYPNYLNENTKKLLSNIILLKPKYENDEHFSLILKLIKSSCFNDNQIVKILNTYSTLEKDLNYQRISNVNNNIKNRNRFLKLINVLKSMDYEIKNVDYLNIFMKRALDNYQFKLIIELLNKINDLGLKPNHETFLILLEQFSILGDSKSSISLLELIIERNEKLTSDHLLFALDAACNNQDIDALDKIKSIMKKFDIKPNIKFIEILMKFNFKLGKYNEIEEIFSNFKINEPTIRMYGLLIKSYLFKKELFKAHVAFNSFLDIKNPYEDISEFYLIKIDYFSSIGEFNKTFEVLDEMRKQKIKITSLHYHPLMSNFNKRGQFNESIKVFNLMNEEKTPISSMIYKDLLTTLIRLSIIRKDNFENPIAVVDNLIKESQKDNLKGVYGKLPFFTIKPVVSALNKYYHPNDALRIMENFKIINPDYEFNERLNFLKQEMLIYSSLEKWGSYRISYSNFENKIKNLLTLNGEAPTNLKKIYNNIIQIVYKDFESRNELVKFSKLFHDLIFVHKFAFTSHVINWVIRRLIMNLATFHDALYIVEKRLIGGYIAQRITHFERVPRLRAGESRNNVPKHMKNGKILKSYLKLGYIYRLVVERQIYNYIIGGKGTNPSKRQVKIKELKEKYPKTMKFLPAIQLRIRRRDEYFRKIKRTYPNKRTREMVRIINTGKRELKKL